MSFSVTAESAFAYGIFRISAPYNYLEQTFEVRYEKTNRAMAAYGLRRNVTLRDDITLSLRPARRRLDSAILGRKRINVGAHEASLLAYAHFCRGAEPLLP